MKDKCLMCPRNCGVNRKTTKGFCGEKGCRVSHVMLHKWEEPLISGPQDSKGSGAIFFTGCNLKCVYCQNHEISQNGEGKRVTTKALVQIFKDLENAGALNINLVTPTHFTDEIIEALTIYKPTIPVVWNTSGYESAKTIEKLKGFVDVFLTDLKYFSAELSINYSSAEDYFLRASEAIILMREVVGEDVIENGIMKKGIIIRHMVLPCESGDSIKILEWIKENLGENTIISIMNQYTPTDDLCNYPKLNRKVKPLEYKRVVLKAVSLGFKNAFTQDESSSSIEFVPEFKGKKEFGF